MYAFNDDQIETCRNYLKERYQPGMNVLFDCLLEGVVSPVVKIVHRIVDGIVDHQDVYYFTSAVNAEYLYDKFANKNSVEKRINIRKVIIWDEHAHDTASAFECSYNPDQLRDKVYLCLNRVARTHRLALLGLMYDRNLVDKGYYSYLHSSHGKNKISDIEEFVKHVSYEFSPEVTDIVRTNVTKNINQLPLKLNIDPDHNATYIMQSDLEYYRNSYFSLVSETFFYNGEQAVFFSEKIFKPIAMKHPFMIVGAPDSLKVLREMGYKTFGSIIDEGYDGIQDPSARMLAIVNEVERISKNQDWQWLDWQEKAKPIVEHNYQVLKDTVKHYRKR